MEYVFPYEEFILDPVIVRQLQDDIENLLFYEIEKEYPKWHGNVLANPQMVSVVESFEHFKPIPLSDDCGPTSIYKVGYMTKRVSLEPVNNLSVDTEIEIPIYCDPYMSWTDNRLIFI